MAAVLRPKKYLYVLQPLLLALCVAQSRGVAPTRFQDLVDGLVTDTDLRAAIDELDNGVRVDPMAPVRPLA